jgi:hypothetical protein
MSRNLAVLGSVGSGDAETTLSLPERWEAEFRPLLGTSDRWEGFCYIMRDQLERDKPVIVETGTLREPGNWKGDGQSTRLWQWVAEQKDGISISVDKDFKACELARRECNKVHVVCNDSVTFLRGFLPFPISLLYLDSIEWGFTKESCVDCWMNQVAELASIWHWLPSGCLIASDDNQTVDRGKPVLTRKIFDALGLQPVYDGYIVVWKKP